MSQTWAAQLPNAVSVADLLATASEAGDGAAMCVFSPDDSVESQGRRGYAALVLAYRRFEEPVAILDDGATALLIREGGVASAVAAATRVLGLSARIGAVRLRVGVAPVLGAPDVALRAARTQARSSRPGEIAGAA